MSALAAVTLVGAAAVHSQPASAQAAPPAVVERGAELGWEALSVCADPNNLPFSNRAGEGFENRLAEIWADELGLEVDYTWFPHRRGFERHTLTAQDPITGEYLCDVIMGVPLGYDLAMTTQPYYRSTYALVYVAGGKLDVQTGDALIALPRESRESLRIGVFTPGPAADWLAFHGMHRQMVPYPALQGDPADYPGKIIEDELLEDQLDAAILWGPIAGYFAARAAPREVAVVPLTSEIGVQFDFPISAGVRFGDRDARTLLESVIASTADQVASLLAEYHVPAIGPLPRDLVYVTSEDGGTISAISAAAQRVVGDVEIETRPPGVEVNDTGRVLSPNEDRLYISNGREGTVSVIDAGTGSAIANVRVGARPRGLGLTTDGKFLYTANTESGDVSIVDTESLNVVATIRVGEMPWGIAVGPAPEAGR